MFEELSKEDFDALTPAQQKYYMEQKKAHDAKKMQDSINQAVEGIKADLAKQNESLLAQIKKDNEDALKDLADKNNLKLEDLQAELKRNKVADINKRLPGFADHIVEKLSTPEGEAMIKDFFKGQREKLNFDVDVDKAALTVPANSVAPEFLPIVGPGHDDIHARNAIPVFPTVADIVKFVQFTLPEDALQPGFEMVGVGQEKPELAYVSALEEAPVRKLAGWLDVPDEIMDDVVGFRAWIAYELPKAYLDAEDYQVFKGDGTGLNLLGLWTQADEQTLPFGSVSDSSNQWDKLMAAITEIRTRKRSTSAAFVSPIFYMELWINKGNTEEYSYPIVMDGNGVLRIGGVPIYWSNVFVDYEGLVGDFARGASLHQRKAMNIAYSDQNKDNFIKNIVTIRLEGRIALAIRVPQAFLKLANTTT